MQAGAEICLSDEYEIFLFTISSREAHLSQRVREEAVRSVSTCREKVEWTATLFRPS